MFKGYQGPFYIAILSLKLKNYNLEKNRCGTVILSQKPILLILGVGVREFVDSPDLTVFLFSVPCFGKPMPFFEKVPVTQ